MSLKGAISYNIRAQFEGDLRVYIVHRHKSIRNVHTPKLTVFVISWHQSDYIDMKPHTVRPVLSGHSKKHQKLVFNTNYCLMQVKSIAECSKGSILQYFRPSLCYYLSLRSLFCPFLSGRLIQVSLYFIFIFCSVLTIFFETWAGGYKTFSCLT